MKNWEMRRRVKLSIQRALSSMFDTDLFEQVRIKDVFICYWVIQKP